MARQYTKEEREWLVKNIPGHTHKETAERFSKIFRPLKVSQVLAYCKNHHIHCGNTGRFPKGNVPWSKGKKLGTHGRSGETQFRKGIRPHNTAPVGTERNLIGYVEVKTAEPNVWELKHRVIWEQHHGPIPEGRIIRFRDGNRENFDIDNLVLIDKQVNMEMVRTKMSKPPAELFDSAVLVSRLNVETRKKHDNRRT